MNTNGEKSFQDYGVDILIQLAKTYKDDNNKIDILKDYMNYVVENALLNHCAVWTERKEKHENIEKISKNYKSTKDTFEGIAISDEGKKAIEKWKVDYKDAPSEKKPNVNGPDYIHWEHITPKSFMYEKLLTKLDEFKNNYISENILRDDIIEILREDKIFILSKQESKRLDAGEDTIKGIIAENPTAQKNKDLILKMRPYMKCKSEAVFRLYYLSLFDKNGLNIYYDGIGKTPENIRNILNNNDLDKYLDTKPNKLTNNNKKLTYAKQNSRLEKYLKHDHNDKWN